MNIIYIVTFLYFAGIIFAGLVSVSPLYFAAGAFVAIIAAFLLRKRETAFTAMLCAVAFCASIFMCGVDKLAQDNSSFSEYLRLRRDDKQLERLRGTVVRSEKRGSDQALVVIAIEGIKVGRKKFLPVRGRAMVRTRGDRLYAPGYGRRVEVEGRAQLARDMSARYRALMAREGVVARLFIPKEGVKRDLGRGDIQLLMELGRRTRERFITTLDQRVGGDEAAVLGRLLLGKDQDMSPEIEDLFRRAGLSHILVVSGLHVGFLITIFMTLSFAWSRRPAVTFCLFVPALIFYYGVTGGGASVARASIMGVVLLVAVLRGSHYSAQNSIFIAALMMMVVDPKSVYSVSAQLSFVSAAGVIFIYPLLANFTGPRSAFSYIAKTIMISIAAQLPLYPILAYYFNSFCLIAPISNIVVVPLSCAALPLDLLACALGVLPGPLSILAVFPAFLAGLLAKLMIVSTTFFASLPFSNISVASPSFLWIIVFECAVVAFVYTLRHSFFGTDEGEKIGLMTLAALCVLLMAPFVWNRPVKGLEATFIDVGEGDATYLEFPSDDSGRTFKMLVDGGRGWGAAPGGIEAAQSVAGRYLVRRGVRRLDVLALTHPEADHLNGLLWVAQNIKVDRFMDIGIPREIVCGVYGESEYCARGGDRAGFKMARSQRIKFIKLLTALKTQGTEYIPMRAGRTYRLPSGAGISILFPDQRLMNEKLLINTSNDISALMKVEYASGSVLLTGDISNKTEEKAVLYQKESLPSSVMKVPHHGSRYSSSALFLKNVKPQAAVISTGGPSYYGHPSAEAVGRYRYEGIKLYRTDEDGNVSCQIGADGKVKCATELGNME